MARLIYLVSDGSYSSYGIRGAFSTKEKAEEFIELSPGMDDPRIEEWELNPFEPQIRKGLVVFSVQMGKEGNVASIYRAPLTWESEYRQQFSASKDCLIESVWARNEKHAIKIVNDTRIRILALNQWPEI